MRYLVGVEILEELVETELEQALSTVAPQSRNPANLEASNALLSDDLLQTSHEGLGPASALRVRLFEDREFDKREKREKKHKV
jgi:hypothetical protein